MFQFRALCAGALVALGAAGVSHAATIATFADPSPSGAQPLFTLTGNTLTGGWGALGLTLETPGLPAPNYSNATFTMTPLTVVSSFSVVSIMSGGTIQFFDSSAALLMQIDFTSAILTMPLSLGSSDTLTATDVTFSGPIIPGDLTLESFAFSFANPTMSQGSVSVTSAFTSSAERIPGPATLAGLGMGLLLMGRRRRA